MSKILFIFVGFKSSLVDILKKIKTGDKTAFTFVYEQYRNEFIQWAVKNYSCRIEEAKDVFQDVIISFYQNVKTDKLPELTSDLKTYLFAIGKHKLLNVVKKNGRNGNFPDSEMINDKLTISNLSELAHDEEQNKALVKQYLAKIPEDCKKILDLYYVQNWDMESIADEMNISSANTAKKRKFDCLKKIAKWIKESTKMILL